MENSNRPPAMTIERAKEINNAIAQAFLKWDGMRPGSLPDFSAFTLQDVIDASNIIAALPAEPSPDGDGRITTCRVVSSRMPRLFKWVLTLTPPAREAPEPTETEKFSQWWTERARRYGRANG